MGSLLATLVLLAPPQEPTGQIRAEYEAFLKENDPAQHPERHKTLASWCAKKGWKSQAAIHDLEFRRHTYSTERAQLAEPAHSLDLERLCKRARFLLLKKEAGEVRLEWLASGLRERRAKVGDGDVHGLVGVLEWAVSEKLEQGLDALIGEILAIDPGNEAAHLARGEVKDGDAWVDPWKRLVQRGGLKDVKVRTEIYTWLDQVRPRRRWTAPPHPATDLRHPGWGSGKIRVDDIRAGDGKGRQFIWVPSGYDSSRSWPLILSLHAGGSGHLRRTEEEEMGYTEYRAHEACGWFGDLHPSQTRAIVVAPWGLNHVYNAFETREGMLDVVDAAIHACERFNIDKRRIYVQGMGIGGTGAMRIAWIIPELCPAFGAWAGSYGAKRPVPDFTGKSFLLYQGAGDAAYRVKSFTEMIPLLQAANARVEHKLFPHEGKEFPPGRVIPPMLEFFQQCENDVEPDLEIVRRVVLENANDPPSIDGAAPKRPRDLRNR